MLMKNIGCMAKCIGQHRGLVANEPNALAADHTDLFVKQHLDAEDSSSLSHKVNSISVDRKKIKQDENYSIKSLAISRGASLLRSMIRAQPFQRRIASSFP